MATHTSELLSQLIAGIERDIAVAHRWLSTPPVDRAAVTQQLIEVATTLDALQQFLTKQHPNVSALIQRAKQLPPPLPREARVAGPLRHDSLGASTELTAGWQQLFQGHIAAAREHARRALDVAPDEAEAMILHAWSAGLDGDTEAAARRIPPNAGRGGAADWHIVLGLISYNSNAFAEATAHFATASQAVPRSRAGLYGRVYLGRSYFRRAMYKDARDHLAGVVRDWPTCVEAMYWLGLATWHTKDRLAAATIWTDAGKVTGAAGRWHQACAEAAAGAAANDVAAVAKSIPAH